MITHAVRRLLKDGNECEVLVKLDFENAYNSVERTAILVETHAVIPQIYPVVHQAYGAPSLLFFGRDVISSEVGVHQGDPLAPALFCLSVNKMVRRLRSMLNAWYQDDGTLGGTAKAVFNDVQEVISRSEDVGMKLNRSKCEIIVKNGSDAASLEALQSLLPGAKILMPSECHLLGAPLTSEALQPALDEKIESVSRLVSRLPALQSHTALFLLKNCLAIPKLVYSLRSTPAWQAETQLIKFDNIIRQGLEKIINVTLNDDAYLQATLPVSRGGIGIRSALSLSIPAYLASTACTFDMVSSLLHKFPPTTDPDRAEALRRWTAATGREEEPVSRYQRMWDIPVLDAQSARVAESATSTEAKARLLASLRKEAGAWLTALPSPNLGNLLNNAALRIAVCLRLGLPMCHPHKCRCGSPVDEFGTHGLSCRYMAGTIARHNELNSILKQSLAAAHVYAITEPEGLFRDDGKRLDGLTLVPWSRGRCLVWDATCADTICKTYIGASSRAAGSAAELRERHKRTLYQGLGNNYVFCPFAVETLGTFGEEALNLTKDLGRRIRGLTGEPRSRLFLTQRISIAIQRGNAISVLATFPPSSKIGLAEIYNL